MENLVYAKLYAVEKFTIGHIAAQHSTAQPGQLHHQCACACVHPQVTWTVTHCPLVRTPKKILIESPPSGKHMDVDY